MSDLCYSLEVLGDKHIACSYFAPFTCVYNVDIDPKGNITVKLRANDYECEASGILKAVGPYKYINAE